MSLLFKQEQELCNKMFLYMKIIFDSETCTLGYNKCTSDLKVYKPNHFFVDAES